jgi:hypothetical protein
MLSPEQPLDRPFERVPLPVLGRAFVPQPPTPPSATLVSPIAEDTAASSRTAASPPRLGSPSPSRPRLRRIFITELILAQSVNAYSCFDLFFILPPLNLVVLSAS